MRFRLPPPLVVPAGHFRPNKLLGRARAIMKRVWPFLFIVLTGWSTWATETTPAWNRVTETPQFLQGKGFGFELEGMPMHLYKKKTVELVVVIPARFVHVGLTNTFSSVMLMNEDLAVDVQTWPHEGQKRAIITIAETTAKSSRLIFYYRNAGKGVTDGTQFVVEMRQILESLRAKKAQQGGLSQ
jgi:hypothetical protein